MAACHRARTANLRTGRMPRVIAWALKWVKESNIAIVPTDKDGGFCIMSKQVLKSEIDRILEGRGNSKSPYRRALVPLSTLADDLIDEYIDICKYITDEWKVPRTYDLKRALISGLREGRIPVARLMVTIKTHNIADIC